MRHFARCLMDYLSTRKGSLHWKFKIMKLFKISSVYTTSLMILRTKYSIFFQVFKKFFAVFKWIRIKEDPNLIRNLLIDNKLRRDWNLEHNWECGTYRVAKVPHRMIILWNLFLWNTFPFRPGSVYCYWILFKYCQILSVDPDRNGKYIIEINLYLFV